jgi:hypothetical protein
LRRGSLKGDSVKICTPFSVALHYKVTDKLSNFVLAFGCAEVVLLHAQGTLVGELAAFLLETGDLPLYIAGGGPALCVWGAGMRGVPDVSADV